MKASPLKDFESPLEKFIIDHGKMREGVSLFVTEVLKAQEIRGTAKFLYKR